LSKFGFLPGGRMGHASGVPWNKFLVPASGGFEADDAATPLRPRERGEAIQGNAQACLDCFVATSAPIPKFA
jgi:hypothetical protein